MGRVTKRPAAELTTEERIRLSEARDVVAELGEREGGPEALTELGYEQRMARARGLELAVQALQGSGATIEQVLGASELFYQFIWKGDGDAEV